MVQEFEKLEIVSIEIHVKGLVQGVGFRPFIYILATKLDLMGWVENRNDGVQIKVQGIQSHIQSFIQSIKEEAPLASNLISISSKESEFEKLTNFQIVKSKDTTEEITEISPDIAVCDKCLDDIKQQENRIDYTLVNCTNCGPRFSIIEDLPYDREKTTMKDFPMCKSCSQEYRDIFDRRFHAQPVACNNCGPQYELVQEGRNIQDFPVILKIATRLIDNGKILAVKGIGGFHLACDALNTDAVKQLRESKHREGKPFAVMFSNIDKLKEFAIVNKAEENALNSWKRPILILEEKKKLAPGVSVGFNTIGAMLPYMPFHYLLFEQLKTPVIVLTSGNISDEPIIIKNDQAIKDFSKIADAIIIYDRDIYNRTDDSVEFVANKKERILRRSRAHAPSPIHLDMNVEGIIATGAELVNCFCIGKGDQAILSQHIGDLQNIETYEFFVETIEQYKKLFRLDPTLIVSDMHPEYLSTKYASNSSIKKVKVQHHHAHIASCMAEHGLDEKVIGVSFDGTGFGDDYNIWGAEFFVCDLSDYQRYTHFDYIPMPGGDKVVSEPWRMGVSYLYSTFGNELINFNLPFITNLNKDKVNLILSAIENKINCPLSSSAGRLFDAVAAITNVCTFSTFHAEAPMRLESIIDHKCKEKYNYQRDVTISFKKTIGEIVEDVMANISEPVISAKFHNTIISIIIDVINEISTKFDINKIVLSGGTFQNKYLLENTEQQLVMKRYEVFTHSIIPCNDGGIALGQLAIAAKRRELKCV